MWKRDRRSFWFPITGLVLAAVLSVGARAAPANWVKLAPPDGRFSIVCPTAPSHQTWQQQDPAAPRTVHLYQCGNADVTVVVAYADAPAGTKIDANAELAANRDGFLERVQATPISSTPFLYQPGEAKLPALDVQASGGGRNYRSFGIVDGERVYQVAVGVPDAPDAKVRIQEVLRSFQLNPAAK